MGTSYLKWGAVISFVVAMLVLIGGGYAVKDQLPPYPERVVSDDGRVILDKDAIIRGQDVYQKYGLMDHGSVWGHGSLRGMDFSATTLHLLGRAMQSFYAKEKYSRSFEELGTQDRENVKAIVRIELKENRYDGSSGTLTLTKAQQSALAEVEKFWEQEFGAGDKQHGFLPGNFLSQDRQFFFFNFVVIGCELSLNNHFA